MTDSVLVTKIALLCCAFLLNACATPSQQTVDSTNYRSKLTIKRPDKSFYSAEYIGPDSGCFPPITNRICEPDPRGKPIYRETGKLEMEEFRFRLISSGVPDGKLMEDMVFLAAADLAKQRGYPFMTHLSSAKSGGCRSIYSTSTFGTINLDTGIYSGNTSLNQDAVCVTLLSGDFIFFKKRDDMGRGVFYRYDSGFLKTGLLMPEAGLYLYTSPNVMIKDHIFVSHGISRIGTSSAWQVIYDTTGLSNDLRAKYRITSTEPYIFEDERKVNAEKAKDPLEQNKLPLQ